MGVYASATRDTRGVCLWLPTRSATIYLLLADVLSRQSKIPDAPEAKKVRHRVCVCMCVCMCVRVYVRVSADGTAIV
jgi:hypothetical protein